MKPHNDRTAFATLWIIDIEFQSLACIGIGLCGVDDVGLGLIVLCHETHSHEA